MSLTLQDVQRIANLARLELGADEAETTLGQLNRIFAMVEQMRTIDTTGVEPLAQPISALMPDLALRLRNDCVSETDRRADYQACAPATEDGLYLVPKVIE